MRLNTAKITKAEPNRRLLGLEFGKYFELISVVIAHVLHELAVHAQHHEHLQVLVAQERVALAHDEVGARDDALCEALGVEGANLRVAAARKKWNRRAWRLEYCR